MNENDRELLDRITQDPDVMVGKPVIKGTRLTVQHILNLLADGVTVEEIMVEYEGITIDDIRACLLYASESVEHSKIGSLKAEA